MILTPLCHDSDTPVSFSGSHFLLSSLLKCFPEKGAEGEKKGGLERENQFLSDAEDVAL